MGTSECTEKCPHLTQFTFLMLYRNRIVACIIADHCGCFLSFSSARGGISHVIRLCITIFDKICTTDLLQARYALNSYCCINYYYFYYTTNPYPISYYAALWLHGDWTVMVYHPLFTAGSTVTELPMAVQSPCRVVIRGWNGLCQLFGDRFIFFEYFISIFL